MSPMEWEHYLLITTLVRFVDLIDVEKFATSGRNYAKELDEDHFEEIKYELVSHECA